MRLLIFLVGVMVVTVTLASGKDTPPAKDGPIPGEGVLESQLQSVISVSEYEDEDENPELQEFDAELQDMHGLKSRIQDMHGVDLQALYHQGDEKDEMEIQKSSEPSPVPGTSSQEEDDAEMEETSNGRILRCGSPTALRFLTSNQWLSCRKSTCNANTCPAHFFDRNEMRKCAKELFQFWQLRRSGSSYYLNGRGTYVYNGAVVGIWYPTTSSWLRASGSMLFRIYARGRSRGSVIRDQDTIVLQHVSTGYYVRFISSRVYLSATCMRRNSFPPSDYYMDHCIYNTIDVAVLGY